MAEGENSVAQHRAGAERPDEAPAVGHGVAWSSEIHIGDEPDKYAMDGLAAEIDCESRLHLCRAACCRLRFPLTFQDIEEGVLQWERDQPYMNRQRKDGYCVHCSADSLRCQVYEQRPTVCRKYDCRQDPRIWSDFERRLVSPYLARAGRPADPSSE